ncbi:MAG: NADPH-dependent reductase [Bacteroidetes bacterium]|nr:NADPH-dependent reductase [Bacteroidota bacterium]
MTPKKNILAISGSTRRNSINESILKFIKEKYSAEVNVELFTGIDSLPHFNPDLDNEQAPASVKAFRQLVRKADGVIICTPEYVFSLPGSLKNALEWMVSTIIFAKKPTALIVASGMGEKAFESLQLIMRTLEANFTGDTALLISGARSRFDAAGMPKDEPTAQELDRAVSSLLKVIEKIK